MRNVLCAGCQTTFPINETIFYRKKRCCKKQECFEAIDIKIKHNNYLKQQRKKANGTYRHGVPIDLKKEIVDRDNNICKMCENICETNKTQVHHIVPVSSGGKDEHENLILLCSSCHTFIHQNSWEEYVDKFHNYTRCLTYN